MNTVAERIQPGPRRRLRWLAMLVVAALVLGGGGMRLSAQSAATIEPSAIGGAGVQQEGDYGAFFATLGEPLNYQPDTLGAVDQSTWIGFFGVVTTNPTSSVEESSRPVISGATGIAEMYPTPFSTTTRILVRLEHPGSVKLSVYDQIGRNLLKLIDGQRPAGEVTIEWTPENLPSGTYLLVLEIDGVSYPSRLIQYYR